MTDYFYYRTIRGYTTVLGSLLNDIKVHKESRLIDVPLSYAGRDKFRSLNSDEEVKKHKIKMSLPRMTFLLVGLDMDRTRKTNSKNVYCLTDSEGNTKSQYQKIPYNFLYSVYLKTKTMDEILQVTEQIVSQFDPFVDVKANGGGIENDSIRISLESLSPEDNFEGSFEESRSLEMTFNFVLEGWIHKEVNSTGGGIIKTVNINFSSHEDFEPVDDLGKISIDENCNITTTENG